MCDLDLFLYFACLCVSDVGNCSIILWRAKWTERMNPAYSNGTSKDVLFPFAPFGIVFACRCSVCAQCDPPCIIYHIYRCCLPSLIVFRSCVCVCVCRCGCFHIFIVIVHNHLHTCCCCCPLFNCPSGLHVLPNSRSPQRVVVFQSHMRALLCG